MDRAWKIVSTVAVIAFILGALCILAGLVTGGDIQRVKDVLYAAYDVENRLAALRNSFDAVFMLIK